MGRTVVPTLRFPGARSSHPDCVILDLGLPDGHGIEIARSPRVWSAMPIIIISAREPEDETVAALDAAADPVTSPSACARTEIP